MKNSKILLLFLPVFAVFGFLNIGQLNASQKVRGKVKDYGTLVRVFNECKNLGVLDPISCVLENLSDSLKYNYHILNNPMGAQGGSDRSPRVIYYDARSMFLFSFTADGSRIEAQYFDENFQLQFTSLDYLDRQSPHCEGCHRGKPIWSSSYDWPQAYDFGQNQNTTLSESSAEKLDSFLKNRDSHDRYKFLGKFDSKELKYFPYTKGNGLHFTHPILNANSRFTNVVAKMVGPFVLNKLLKDDSTPKKLFQFLYLAAQCDQGIRGSFGYEDLGLKSSDFNIRKFRNLSIIDRIHNLPEVGIDGYFSGMQAVTRFTKNPLEHNNLIYQNILAVIVDDIEGYLMKSKLIQKRFFKFKTYWDVSYNNLEELLLNFPNAEPKSFSNDIKDFEKATEVYAKNTFFRFAFKMNGEDKYSQRKNSFPKISTLSGQYCRDLKDKI